MIPTRTVVSVASMGSIIDILISEPLVYAELVLVSLAVATVRLRFRSCEERAIF